MDLPLELGDRIGALLECAELDQGDLHFLFHAHDADQFLHHALQFVLDALAAGKHVVTANKALLAEHGPVHQDVAIAMARGARARLGASYGLATTGVAGPGPADGQPAGTVFVAASGPATATVTRLTLRGGRAEVRAASVEAVLSLLVSALQEDIS